MFGFSPKLFAILNVSQFYNKTDFTLDHDFLMLI